MLFDDPLNHRRNRVKRPANNHFPYGFIFQVCLAVSACTEHYWGAQQGRDDDQPGAFFIFAYSIDRPLIVPGLGDVRG